MRTGGDVSVQDDLYSQAKKLKPNAVFGLRRRSINLSLENRFLRLSSGLVASDSMAS
jgi:hypothetical protein